MDVQISSSGLALLVGGIGDLTVSASGAASGELKATGRLNFLPGSCIAEAVLVTPLEATFALDITTLSFMSLYFPLLNDVVGDHSVTAKLTRAETIGR